MKEQHPITKETVTVWLATTATIVAIVFLIRTAIEYLTV